MRFQPLLLVALVALLTPPAAQGQTEAPEAPAAEETYEVVPISIKGWTVADYAEFLVQHSRSVVLQAMAINAAAEVSPGAADAQIGHLLGVLEDAARRIEGLPPWRKDTAFRDACILNLRETQDLLRNEATTLATLLNLERPSNADLTALGEAHRAIGARAVAIDEKVVAANEAFAKRNRLVLVDDGWTPPEQPQFTAEGIPPEGVAVDPGYFMVLTISYSNALIHDANGVADAVNAAVQTQASDPGALQRHNEEGRAVLAATARRVAATDAEWVGEGGLYTAVKDVLDTADRVLTLNTEFAELAGKRRLNRKDKKRASAISAEVNQLWGPSIDSYNAALQAWIKTWSLAEYEAFKRSLGLRPPGEEAEEQPAEQQPTE